MLSLAVNSSRCYRGRHMTAVEALRANVKRLLKGRHRKDLADGIGVTPAMVSQLLNGSRGVPIDTAERIADF